MIDTKEIPEGRYKIISVKLTKEEVESIKRNLRDNLEFAWECWKLIKSKCFLRGVDDIQIIKRKINKDGVVYMRIVGKIIP